jgi:hypothetical protein
MTTAKRIALYQLYVTRSIALLMCVCAVSVFLYCTFLMLAVQHTASRTALQSKVDDLTLELSTQETQYLSDMKQLTPEHATELGYVVPTQVTPVFTDNSGETLTLR